MKMGLSILLKKLRFYLTLGVEKYIVLTERQTNDSNLVFPEKIIIMENMRKLFKNKGL